MRKSSKLCYIILFLVVIFISRNSIARGQSDEMDSLLCRLDHVIDIRGEFSEIKDRRIDSLVNEYNDALSIKKYHLGKEIFHEYLKYNHDSAKFYFGLNKKVALAIGDRSLIVDNSIDEISLLSTVGMYIESWNLIEHIEETELDSTQNYRLEKAKEFYYEGLVSYSDGYYKEVYKDSLNQVYGRMLSLLKLGDVRVDDVTIRRLFHQHKWKEVIARVDNYLPKLDKQSNKYAMTLYMKAIAYKNLSYDDHYIKTLIECSICDILSATKEYMSLGDLSWALFERGDIDRAHHYAKVALKDANDFKARQHSMQIANILPIIDDAHNRLLLQDQFIIQFAAIILFLTTLLLVIFFLNYRKRTRKIVQLKDTLESVNNALMDSDRLKDRYIGFFIHQCSDYIIRLTDFKKKIHQLSKDKNYQEIIRITSEYRKITDEKKELYQQFDKAFLYLYPTFLEDLNNLLNVNCSETVVDGLMTTQQRICALIRVGIDESSQIASFLGYSVNTVYAYRTKMRNQAKERDTFEIDILNIGSKNTIIDQ